MGKPYETELQALPETYGCCMQANIEGLTHALAKSASKPVVFVGSGGSLSAAYLGAALHQSCSNSLAKAATPLEIASWDHKKLDDFSFVLLSAGGENSDILGIFKRLVVQEPHRLITLTCRKNSSLGLLAEGYQYVDAFNFKLPSGKDGFLATNSLLAFSILLTRAYGQVNNSGTELPSTLDQVISPDTTFSKFRSDLETACMPLWSREHLIVLYSPWLQAAASDIESKFTEAALGPVQIADYRHFAHGRHHWLAKRRTTTSVLALIDVPNASLAERTLNLLPSDVPITRLAFSTSHFKAALASMISSICLAGCAGGARGIDPGRPGVPTFGRKIYHLKAIINRRVETRSIEDVHAATIIKRKFGFTTCIDNGRQLGTWKSYYAHFQKKLLTTSFGAIVFDYDGTIASERERFSGPDRRITKCLIRLLEKGIAVGVATGRGLSVKDALQKAIPRRFWEKVIVAYHNGANIYALDLDPNLEQDQLSPDVQLLRNKLLAESDLFSGIEIKLHPHQITIIPPSNSDPTPFWLAANEFVHRTECGRFSVRCSSHSIDILRRGITKQAIIAKIKCQESWNHKNEVLCIGDRGQWPGNDSDLLAYPFSLSVHTVSTDPNTCWNLAPPGHRGPQALYGYFQNFDLKQGAFSVKVGIFGERQNEGYSCRGAISESDEMGRRPNKRGAPHFASASQVPIR